MQYLSLFESNSQPFTINSHLSSNFSNPTNYNLTKLYTFIEGKSYIPLTSCTLEHILATTNFTNREKLYYLLTDSLALINKNNGGRRSIALPSEDWARLLDCSRSSVFIMQKSLEDKGYLAIKRDWNGIGLNNRNFITPVLPASVFNHLNEKYPDRVGEHTPYNPLVECKRAYLDRTKLFIRFNYNLLKLITSYEYINSLQKVLWLGFFARGYKNCMLKAKEGFNRDKYDYNNDGYSGGNHNNCASLSFIASYRELAEQYSCSTKELSKSIRALEALGFIKAQNFYIRKKDCNGGNDSKEGSDDAYASQERQDQSLWKITVLLPQDCMLELEKVKDRSNLKDHCSPKPKGINYITDSTTVIIEDTALLHSSRAESYSEIYIDSIMEKLEAENTSRDAKQDKKIELENHFVREDTDLFLSTATQVLSTSLSLLSSLVPLSSPDCLDTFTNVDKVQKNDNVAKYDPDVAKSRLLLNKDSLLKINSKSNLEAAPKVLFDDFLKEVKSDDVGENADSEKKVKTTKTKRVQNKEFNIHSELIRAKLAMLPRDKVEKARRFAYSLVSKKLACGDTADLSKNELAKQLIHHAATWKPTKLGSISREKEIDTALSVAWKAIVAGTWQVPLELARAQVLQYEFNDYRKKYLKFGVLSHEAKALEREVSNLLGGYCDLVGKITEGGGDSDWVWDSNEKNMEMNTSTSAVTERLEGLKYGAVDILTIIPDLLTVSSLNGGILLGSGDTLGHKIEQEQETGLLGYQLDKIAVLRGGILEPKPYMPDDRSNEIGGITDISGKANPIIDNDEANHQINLEYLLDYNCRDVEQSKSNSFDLLRVPEPQRYLKVTPSSKKGDDSVILETTNGKEYCVRLKELEMNNEGEFVMTLKPVKTNLFLEHRSRSMLNLKQDDVTNSGTRAHKANPYPKKGQTDKWHELLDLSILGELALEQEATQGRDEYFEKFQEFVKRDKGAV